MIIRRRSSSKVVGTNRYLNYIANIPQVRSRGFEGDLAVRPADWLSLTGSIALTDATYRDYPNGRHRVRRSIPRPPIRADRRARLHGQRLAGVPKWAASVGGDVTHAVGGGGRGVSARRLVVPVVTTTRSPATAATGLVPGYGMVNARAGIRLGDDGRYDLSIWARNLFDKDYFQTLTSRITASSPPSSVIPARMARRSRSVSDGDGDGQHSLRRRTSSRDDARPRAATGSRRAGCSASARSRSRCPGRDCRWSLFIPQLYASHFGLSLATIGFIFFLGRFWDVASDPIVGTLSDRTRTRSPAAAMDRRGGLLFGVGSALLFFPPMVIAPLYLGVALFVFYTGWTMIEIPFSAWAGDCRAGYHERTRIATYQHTMRALGLCCADPADAESNMAAHRWAC